MLKKTFLVSFLFSCLFLVAFPAQAKRIALVIGNDNYSNLPQYYQLQKARNDAKATSKTFAKLRFEVLSGFDLTRRSMNFKLSELANKIEPGDEVLFFFAGHGVRIDGLNYLLPSDIPSIDKTDETLLKSEAIRVDEITDLLRKSGARLSILVLDACRNNPYKNNKGRSIGGQRGLAPMDPPEGSLILFSAGAGQTALDRLDDKDPHPNSVFTRTFLPLVEREGLELARLSRKVKAKVRDLAKTIGHTQTPAVYNEVIGDIFLSGKGRIRNKVSEKNGADELLWQTINNSIDVEDFKFYLQKFPSGKFAVLAELNIKKLTKVKKKQRKRKNVALHSHRLSPKNSIRKTKQKTLTRSLDKTYKEYKNARDFTILPDGGYAITGGNEPTTSSKTRSFILRLDRDGRILWQKLFGGEHYNYAKSITSLENGDIVFASLRQKKKQAVKYLIIKTNINGSIIWEKEIGQSKSQEPEKIITLKRGGYAVLGVRKIKNNSSRGRMIVSRLDKHGNHKWTFQNSSCHHSGGKEIIELPNGNFIIAGYCNKYISGKRLVHINVTKLNQRGELIWQKLYPDTGDWVDVKKIIIDEKQNLSLVVKSTRGNWRYAIARFLKLNSSGDLIKQSSIGSKKDSIEINAVTQKNNTLLITDHYKRKVYQFSVRLLKLTLDGKLLDENLILDNNSNQTSSAKHMKTKNISVRMIKTKKDGSLVLVGQEQVESYWWGLTKLMTFSPNSSSILSNAK